MGLLLGNRKNALCAFRTKNAASFFLLKKRLAQLCPITKNARCEHGLTLLFFIGFHWKKLIRGKAVFTSSIFLNLPALVLHSIPMEQSVSGKSHGRFFKRLSQRFFCHTESWKKFNFQEESGQRQESFWQLTNHKLLVIYGFFIGRHEKNSKG